MGVLDRATETVAVALNLVTFAVVAGLLTRGVKPDMIPSSSR